MRMNHPTQQFSCRINGSPPNSPLPIRAMAPPRRRTQLDIASAGIARPLGEVLAALTDGQPTLIFRLFYADIRIHQPQQPRNILLIPSRIELLQ